MSCERCARQVLVLLGDELGDMKHYLDADTGGSHERVTGCKDPRG